MNAPHRSIWQRFHIDPPLMLGLLALLSSGAHHFMNPAFCGFYRLVVQLHVQLGQPPGRPLRLPCASLGLPLGRLCGRLGLGRCLAGDVFVPDLFRPGRIAVADLLAKGKAGDVAASRLQFLTGLDDRFGCKFGGAHGGVLW